MTALIEVKDVVKSFRRGRVRALDGVSLEVDAGESLGIIGPNGAGKSTLFYCLLGLQRVDAGTIRVAGRPPDDLAVRRLVGFLPERVRCARGTTGREFVAQHHALALLDSRTRTRDVEDALSRVGLPPTAWDQPAGAYSRGMLQRLGLAQALLGEPAILLLDEPTTGIDPSGVMRTRELLQAEKLRGTTLVINSHDLPDVARNCSRVAYVEAGRVEHVQTGQAGASLPQTLRIRFLTAPSKELVTRVAVAAGAECRTLAGAVATIRVADDRAAARLLDLLREHGLAVVQAASEGSHLERLFRRHEERT